MIGGIGKREERGQMIGGYREGRGRGDKLIGDIGKKEEREGREEKERGQIDRGDREIEQELEIV